MIAARLGRGVAISCLGGLSVLGLEVAIARRRDYLYEPPSDILEAHFGVGDPLHLVVIGDSTAVGVGAGTRAHSYPAVLARLIGESIPVRLDVLGRSGLRMADVRKDLAAEAAALVPDVVLVGVGANDAIHLTPLRTLQESLGASLDLLLRDCDASVLVGLGPRLDAPALPRPLRDIADARCRRVNRALRRAAESRSVPVVDLRAAIGVATARGPRGYYSSDGFHPSAAVYAAWAEAMLPAVLEAALARRAARRGGRQEKDRASRNL